MRLDVPMTMPDSPKPSGTTVTHNMARRLIAATRGSAVHEDLLRYIQEQEAAEWELKGQRDMAERLFADVAKKLETAEQDVTDAKMQRDVFCEKLNEYIDKTKEAEKRAETAERELSVYKRVCSGCGTTNDACNRLANPCCEKCPHIAPPDEVEQARQEGYERGKAERDG